MHVDLPPLGARREDIPLLVQQCLDDLAAESSQPKRSCSPEAMELLAAARWPGNVRQLRMVVRQAATTGAGAMITPQQVEEAQGRTTQLPSFDEARDEFTRSYLVQLLQITEGNVSQAARLAKRNRTDFYKLLSRHGIEPEEFKDENLHPASGHPLAPWRERVGVRVANGEPADPSSTIWATIRR